MLNTQPYGGGLWRTWFDRDLGLAGKIIVQNKETKKITSHLWDSTDAVMNIASLCIHLESSKEREGFAVNREQHLKPILSMACVDQLMGEGVMPFPEGSNDTFKIETKHFKTFLDRLARDINVDIDEIIDFELSAYDHHKPAITGLHREFLSSPRLDNLCSSLCSLDSLI